MKRGDQIQKKRILCFGDSLTWGWVAVAEGAPTTRFPWAERWTGVMGEALGAGYEIVEEGLSARTTSIDDPVDPRLNGSAYLPAALASPLPLDLVVIMLGTNDTKSLYRRTPYEIAIGMPKLVGQVLTSRAAASGPCIRLPRCWSSRLCRSPPCRTRGSRACSRARTLIPTGMGHDRLASATARRR